MKPEWCDETSWAAAVKVAHPIIWLSAKDEQNGTEHIARALLAAEQRGMEKAADIADANAHEDCEVAEAIAAAIRQAAKEITP